MRTRFPVFLVTCALLGGGSVAVAAVPDAKTSGPRGVLIRPTAVSDAKTLGPRLAIIRPTAVSDAKTVGGRVAMIRPTAVSDAKTLGPRASIVRPTSPHIVFAVSDAKSAGARALLASTRPTVVSGTATCASGASSVQTPSARALLDLNAPRSNRD